MTAPGHRSASPRSRGRRWLALAWLVVVGTSSGVHAQDTSSSRNDSTGTEGPATVQAAPADVATAGAPPFWVAGVVIAPAQRSALLVVLDDTRREVGVVTLREGESYGGYRVAAVESARVLLEQNGAVFPVPVGRPYTGPKGVPDVSARPGSGPIFIPGPDKPTPDLEYTGPQVRRGGGNAPSGGAGGTSPDPEAVDNFLQRVFSNPQLQQKIEERRPIIREKLERARQDGQVSPDAPSPTPTQGTSR